MKPKEYVELSLEIMPNVIKELREEMNNLKEREGEQLKKDPFKLLETMMKTLFECLDPYKDKIEEAGLTIKEFNSYQRTHKEELKQYLESNPQLEEKIEELKIKMKDIMK